MNSNGIRGVGIKNLIIFFMMLASNYFIWKQGVLFDIYVLLIIYLFIPKNASQALLAAIAAITCLLILNKTDPLNFFHNNTDLFHACVFSTLGIYVLQVSLPSASTRQLFFATVAQQLQYCEQLLKQISTDQADTLHRPPASQVILAIGFNPGLRAGFRLYLLRIHVLQNLLLSAKACLLGSARITPSPLFGVLERLQHDIHVLTDYFLQKHVLLTDQLYMQPAPDTIISHAYRSEIGVAASDAHFYLASAYEQLLKLLEALPPEAIECNKSQAHLVE